jgi:hypothetical protein
MAVHAGSSGASRRWPADRFAALIERMLLENQTLRVVMTGVPSETELVASIRSAVPEDLRPRVHSSVGLTDLKSMMGLLDRAALAVSNDTGTVHLARAWGTPLVAVLGPENDLRWGPYWLGRGPCVSLRYEVPCANCARKNTDTHFCMRSLPVDEVHSEVSRMLKESLSKPVVRKSDQPATVRLVRKNIRRSWHELDEAGFRLPLCSVVLFTGEIARSIGQNPLAGAEGMSAALASITEQTYPRLEVVLVRAEGTVPMETSALGDIPMKDIACPKRDIRAIWSCVLSAAEGMAIAGALPGMNWASDHLDLGVAAFLRTEWTLARTDHPIAHLDRIPLDGPIIATTMYRREALQKLLSGETSKMPLVPIGRP